MEKDEILKILTDWNFWETPPEIGISRPVYLEEIEKLLSTGQIVSLTGARRTGKSTILLQFAKHLIEDKHVDKRNVLVVNFEDYRFSEPSLELIGKVYETYLEKVKPDSSTRPYLFLDEIQKVGGWERFVRSLHEMKKAEIVVSGSTSKLLGGEFGTALTGRHLSLGVFPLGFWEFLEFKNVKVRDEVDLTAKRVEVKKLFAEYLEFGGFPAVVLKPEKPRLLLEYFDDILSRDIVERFRIREVAKLKTLARYYLTNVSNTMTFNSVKKFLKMPLRTVERFSYYIENSGMTYFVLRYSSSLKEQENAPRKIYSIDNGLANVVGLRISENFGKLAENMVFVELKRRCRNNPLTEVFYWKNGGSGGWEVDFLVRNGMNIESAIQVCWDIAKYAKTKEREVRSLLKAMDEFGLNEGLIITEDYEGTENLDGKIIKYLPLWKWLLLGWNVQK